MSPSIVWLILVLLYGAFFGWYTAFGGPLTSAEIERNIEGLRQAGMAPERLEVWRAFMQSDSGDDFAMLNAIALRDTPLEAPGVPAGESAAAVLSRYSDPFLGRALRRAAHPVLGGRASADAIDLWGIEGAEHWSHGAVVRYRSRRDLMDQVLHTSQSGIHAYKIAAMEKTIAFPLDPWFQLGDPRLLLALLLLVTGLGLHLRHAKQG